MPLSPVPGSRQSDGKRRIYWVPSGSNPLSVAVLTGASAKDITYSFTPDGWNPGGSQETVNDPRLTLVQSLSRPGKFTGTLATRYVESPTDTGSAHQVLKPTTGSQNGPAGYFVERRGVDNVTAPAVGDIVDVYTVQMGVPLPDQPTENGVDTKSQGAFLTAPTQYDQALVA